MSTDPNELFVNNFVKKQESMMMDMVRKFLEADTKREIYEMMVADSNKEKEALKQEHENQTKLLNEALRSLELTTQEKKSFEAAREGEKAQLQTVTVERNKLVSSINTKDQEINKLTQEISILKNDYNTLKNNYSLVKNENDNLKNDITVIKNSIITKQSRKRKKEEASEWVDGDTN